MKTMEKAQIQQYRWKLECRREDAVRLLGAFASETRALEMLTLRKTLATSPSAASQRNLCSSKLAGVDVWSE